jgi:hypothetical protein
MVMIPTRQPPVVEGDPMGGVKGSEALKGLSVQLRSRGGAERDPWYAGHIKYQAPLGAKHDRRGGGEHFRRLAPVGVHPPEQLQIGIDPAASGVIANPVDSTPSMLSQAATIASMVCEAGRSRMNSSISKSDPSQRSRPR